jgi:hypothetical protein
MALHAFMQDAEMVRQHVAKYGTDLDGRSLEILREVIDRDIASFLPIIEVYERATPDIAAEAKRELASVRKLRASLEPK